MKRSTGSRASIASFLLSAYGPALALGLYLARVLAEALRGAWGNAAPPILALLGMAGGGLVGHLAARRGLALTPAWVLLIYVLWPRLDPAVVVGSGFVAAVTALAGGFPAVSRPSSTVRLSEAALFLIALVIYVGTL
ncbi:MAG: hypothetical protein C4310_07970, partial [Chloroflexota bacterium]